jgi:hypothetical protein
MPPDAARLSCYLEQAPRAMTADERRLTRASSHRPDRPPLLAPYALRPLSALAASASISAISCRRSFCAFGQLAPPAEDAE